MTRETIRLTREELYEQVWAHPMRELAQEYGLSDVGLAKICRRLDVPLPGRGYWAKKDAGRAPARPALPEARANMEAAVVFNKPNQPTPGPAHEAEAERLIAFENAPENRIVVDRHLEEPNPLTVRTEKSLRAAKPDDTNRLRPRAKKCFNVHVCPDSLDRVTPIVDALAKALEARSFALVVAEDDESIQIQVMGVNHKISIEERTTRKVRELTPAERKRKEKEPWLYWGQQYEYLPTGRLTLRIENYGYGARQTWSDGKQQRIEDCLNEFLVGLIQTSVRIHAERRDQERRKQEREEQRRRQHETELDHNLEMVRLSTLRAQVKAWSESRQIRAFINAVRRRASDQHRPILPDSDLGRWLNWISEYVDQLDPLHGDLENFRLVEKDEIIPAVPDYLL